MYLAVVAYQINLSLWQIYRGQEVGYLVDEIRLYNQNKVSEGKQNRDLYQRLKEDIEKSRVTYEKRFGDTLAASANYFNQELIRILADNDIALMGGNFPQ